MGDAADMNETEGEHPQEAAGGWPGLPPRPSSGPSDAHDAFRPPPPDGFGPTVDLSADGAPDPADGGPGDDLAPTSVAGPGWSSPPAEGLVSGWSTPAGSTHGESGYGGAGYGGWPPVPPSGGPPGPGWGQPGGPDPYWTPQPPRRGSISVAITALLVLVAALAGVGIGRSLPNSSSTSSAAPVVTVPSGGGGSSGSGPAGTAPGVTLPGASGGTSGGGSSGGGSSGGGTSGGGNTGTGTSGTGNSGTGSSGTGNSGGTSSGGKSSTGAGGPRNARSIAAKVDPALVDINTDITYDGTEAAGTGIVLTSGGLVLTNNHVINGASSISVTDIGNQHTYSATVVGYDESSDVAIIQIKAAKGLKTAHLGQALKTRVGLPIVAIGNAGGRGGVPSVAAGSITALDQSITASDEGNGTSEQLSGLIQTNADVQPGDSGGSLVNANGVVIGIDTAAAENATDAHAAQGFAIPIATATGIGVKIEQKKASATVHIGPTAFLGIEFNAAALSVGKVLPGTAAQRAGLLKGDTITSFGGQAVKAPDDLTKLLVKYHPGDMVTLTWTTATHTTGRATVILGTGPAA